MNKKIKVIELFNRINENKNIPEKIKYHDIEYKYDEDMQEYYACKEGRTTYFYKWAWLDTEVEILEDEKIDIQDIEELQIFSDSTVYNYNDVDRNRKVINDLVKAVKQLDKKINKED